MRKLLAASMIALSVAAIAAAVSTGAGTYQRFANPQLAAKLRTRAAAKDHIRLFHPCAVVNPYLIRCGGSAPGGGADPKASRHRVTILWRKLNPYMLAWAAYQFGRWTYGTIETKVAY